MFWSGNYIVVRELNFLLKEENVSLAQVLEADDILQECKADNKALIQFLTRPEILSELVLLITEEPRADVELTQQYRHASAACEVLTSQLSALADRLSLDNTLMHRLCDFINRPPPLNPLLASYFSKTIEMLLERSPKQDWYLYHIVCLRVLDFLKTRRDFLPNLLRHLSTSAIADTFKCLLRLDDLFNKILMEWLDEHQFLESLLAVVCCSYNGEGDAAGEAAAAGTGETNHTEGGGAESASRADNDRGENNNASPVAAESQSQDATRAARLVAVASANAAALLTDLVLNGCALEGANTRGRTAWCLTARLQSEALVRQLLQGMFTSPGRHRPTALANGAAVLLAMLSHEPIIGVPPPDESGAGSAEGAEGGERTGVERAVAPHLPLLHQALLTHTLTPTAAPPPVGWSRVRVAALLAQLALSDSCHVPETMLTLGTPGVVMDLMFQYPNNNFLHAEAATLLRNALNNRTYRLQYAQHLLGECSLLTRLMDVFEENEAKRGTSTPRAGLMGHVILMLRRIWRAVGPPPPSPPAEALLLAQLELPADVIDRWSVFVEDKLKPVAQQHDTPLGGYYPSDNIYEVADLGVETNYEFNDLAAGGMDDIPDDGIQDDDNPDEEFQCGDINEILSNDEDFSDVGADTVSATPQELRSLARGKRRHRAMNALERRCFLKMARERIGDDMWEDSPLADEARADEASAADVHDILSAVPPWESNPCSLEGGSGEEGWAQFNADFGADPFGAPADPFGAPVDPFASTNIDSGPKFEDTRESRASLDERSKSSLPAAAIESDDFTPFASAPPPGTDSSPHTSLTDSHTSKMDPHTSTADPHTTVDSHVVAARPPALATDSHPLASDSHALTSDSHAPDILDDNAVSSDRFELCWREKREGANEMLQSVEANLSNLQLQPPALQLEQSQDTLSSNLLTAMSAMTPADIANLVNANMTPERGQHCDGMTPAPGDELSAVDTHGDEVTPRGKTHGDDLTPRGETHHKELAPQGETLGDNLAPRQETHEINQQNTHGDNQRETHGDDPTPRRSTHEVQQTQNS